MGELLPCPFCGNAPNPDPQNDDCPVPAGSRADGEFYLTIWCEACGAEGGKRLTRADAITAWNTRPRTEGRGDGKGWKEIVDHIVPAIGPVSNEFVAEWALWKDRDRIRSELLALSPPIREPEISRAKRDEIARIIDPEIFADLDLVASQAPQFIPSYSGQRNVDAAYAKADAILNLAPVGGRGEEGSSRADLSPASRSPTRNPAGLVCDDCGETFGTLIEGLCGACDFDRLEGMIEDRDRG